MYFWLILITLDHVLMDFPSTMHRFFVNHYSHSLTLDQSLRLIQFLGCLLWHAWFHQIHSLVRVLINSIGGFLCKAKCVIKYADELFSQRCIKDG